MNTTAANEEIKMAARIMDQVLVFANMNETHCTLLLASLILRKRFVYYLSKLRI